MASILFHENAPVLLTPVFDFGVVHCAEPQFSSHSPLKIFPHRATIPPIPPRALGACWPGEFLSRLNQFFHLLLNQRAERGRREAETWIYCSRCSRLNGRL